MGIHANDVRGLTQGRGRCKRVGARQGDQAEARDLEAGEVGQLKISITSQRNLRELESLLLSFKSFYS
jgi:hypothetical protein